jgi:hypothetical protein
VREVPESTVGADERLLQHRTTPVTVDLWVDNILPGRLRLIPPRLVVA